MIITSVLSLAGCVTGSFLPSPAPYNDRLPNDLTGRCERFQARFGKTLWHSAYGEGWGLYAESPDKELGLYSDPIQGTRSS